MATAAQHPADMREREARQQGKQGRKKESKLARVQGDVKPLLTFWTKINNDWIFNLSGLLAYTFLMSTFPLLLVVLAIAGFVLGALSPATWTQFQHEIQAVFPSGAGATFVTAALTQLSKNAGILFVVGIVTAAFTGSRLFITLESCFSIIFRLRPRDAVHQNLMAFGMLLIYIILIPIISLGSIIPTAIVNVIKALGISHSVATEMLSQVLGILVSVVFAAILFAAIYVVVPNRPVRVREVWQGTLVGAALLVIYQLVFPIYERLFLHPNNYGSLAGFAIVILVFFYYLGFIVLLGAEVNSWAAGQRETLGPLPTVLHEVQAHDTTRGAAGPTAGLPQEDLQTGKGAETMKDTPSAIEHERKDHRTNLQPPKPAEAHKPGPEYRTDEQRERRYSEAERELQGQRPTGDGAGGEHHDQQAAGNEAAAPAGAGASRMARSQPSDLAQSRRPPMSRRERQALVAVLVAAGATAVPVLARLFGQGGTDRPTATA